jgi:hypothetical protein
MHYAVETGLGAVICIPSFIRIDSSMQKLLRWDKHTSTQTAC